MNNDSILLVELPPHFLYLLIFCYLPFLTLPITVEHMKEHPSKYIGIAEKVVCRDAGHLESFFQDVIDKGGEGIILRDPQALLQPGRTPSYLKHKVNNKR